MAYSAVQVPITATNSGTAAEQVGSKQSDNLSAANRANSADDAQNAQIERSQNSTWQAPAKYFERRMFTDGELQMPDGAVVPFWGFEDPIAAPGQKLFPSPAIRMREGEVAHVKLETLSAVPAAPAWPHTVAHSFARSGRLLAVQKCESLIYQWQPKKAGTWLYQSHLSSVRDFELGLFGLLIVDPQPDDDGLTRAYRGGPAYDVERCWVLDDVDPDWHTAAGLLSGAPATERERMFVPQYFLINGVPNTQAMHDERVAIDAKAGDKVLIRLLNASFSLVRVKIEGLQGQIISVDGNALASAEHPWSKWCPVKPNHPVYLATGARNDILIDLDPEKSGIIAKGDYLVTFEFLDWEKRAIRNAQATSPLNVGRAVTRIRVT